ncbi:MAG: NUDIX hydrolase [Patescibacteria group bacterium]
MSDADRAARLKRYFEFMKSHPELFTTPEGGVRILFDPTEIATVERAIARNLEARMLPPEGADVGVMLCDPWFYVVRDAVEFPDGSRRTHARVINRTGNGSAVLPVLRGKIVLVRHFRHALRRSLLEIPRGGIEPGSSPEDTAHTEIREEIGAQIGRLEMLGFLYGKSDLFNSGVHLYFAELETLGTPQIGEGIASISQFTVTEFEDMMRRGEILDSFTVAAYARAKLYRLI